MFLLVFLFLLLLLFSLFFLLFFAETLICFVARRAADLLMCWDVPPFRLQSSLTRNHRPPASIPLFSALTSESRTVDSFHAHTLVITDASGRAAACATIGHTLDAAGQFENGGGPALTLAVDLDGMEPTAFPLSTGTESAAGEGSNGLIKYLGTTASCSHRVK